MAAPRIIYQDEELIQWQVQGKTGVYEVTKYFDDWFCTPCPGFYFRGHCSHVDQCKEEYQKMTCRGDVSAREVASSPVQ